MTLPVTLSTTLKLTTTPRLFASACPPLLIPSARRSHFSQLSNSPSSASTATSPRPLATTTTTTTTVLAGSRRTMTTNGEVQSPEGLRMNNPVIFVCDVQDRFRDAIHEFDRMVTTIEKLLKFAQKLPLPIYATTQNAVRLGHTVPRLAANLPANVWDKTRFSMLDRGNTPGFNLRPRSSVALVGIESHICITQTALDLRDAGHKVYVIADGVSSCNQAEVVVALDRLRAEQGITVTTSESWMYECVGDASHPAFKALFQVVKGSMADTKNVLEALPVGAKI